MPARVQVQASGMRPAIDIQQNQQHNRRLNVERPIVNGGRNEEVKNNKVISKINKRLCIFNRAATHSERVSWFLGMTQRTLIWAARTSSSKMTLQLSCAKARDTRCAMFL